MCKWKICSWIFDDETLSVVVIQFHSGPLVQQLWMIHCQIRCFAGLDKFQMSFVAYQFREWKWHYSPCSIFMLEIRLWFRISDFALFWTELAYISTKKKQPNISGRPCSSGNIFIVSYFIPTWIGNYIHYKVWDEVIYPFLNFNGCTAEV